MTPDEPDSQEDETAIALICACAVAIVSVVSPDGKDAYREIKKLIREISR